MNKRYYLITAGIVFILFVGWLVELHYGHVGGKALILQTTRDEEWKNVKSELTYIADHTADIKWPERDKGHADAYSLSSLHKVAIGHYTIDSSQIKNTKGYNMSWYAWRTRMLNAKLLSEPVYIVEENIKDTARQ